MTTYRDESMFEEILGAPESVPVGGKCPVCGILGPSHSSKMKTACVQAYALFKLMEMKAVRL